MDCEKFESIVLDELYGELDEVTSAAAKRHVAGCARCASMLSGLRATKRVAVLPLVEPPADLEERILAAAREAQKVVPMGRRLSNFVSLAGSWAMRPQTAMAALFLLMIGSSALLLRGKSHAPASIQVSEQGEPVASVMTDTIDRPADKSGAPSESGKDSTRAAPIAAIPPSPAATAAAAPSAAGGSAGALGGSLDSLGGFAQRPSRRAAEPDGISQLKDLEMSGKGGGGGGAGPGSPPPPPAAHYATGNAYSAPAAPQKAAAAPAAKPKGAPLDDTVLAQSPPSDFDDGMNAFNGGDYATATQLFDGVAKKGDMNAALWEARSVHKGSGAAAAAPMFDRIAQQGGASAIGYDAMFDAAKCYREMGQIEAARQRLNQLLLVPSYISRAQAELAAMNPKASAKTRAPAQQQQQQASPPAQPATDAY